MLAGLPVAILLMAQAAGEAPAAAAPAAEQTKPADRCPTLPNAQPGEIVVCGERPQGYRLDPDVLEASRGKRSGGPLKRPERHRDTSCAVVGAAGCIGAGAGINLIGAALTAAEMAARLVKGQEIGSMFVTDPQPTEYQRYLEAKRRREAEQAEAAAMAKAKAKSAPAERAVPEPVPAAPAQ
jgi:hypothetical protein